MGRNRNNDAAPVQVNHLTVYIEVALTAIRRNAHYN
jgi:hypothetical protein